MKALTKAIGRFSMALVSVWVIASLDQADGQETAVHTFKSGSDGIERQYLLYLPKDHKLRDPLPLLIALNPTDNDGEKGLRIYLEYGLAEHAGAEGFAVMCLSGRPVTGWDEMAVRDALDALAAARSRLPIDSDRIYLFGAGSGGNGVYNLALRHPDLFAAMAVAKGVGPTDISRAKGGFDHTPIFYIFPRADYLFIIGIVMSLLALLFSYDAVAGEREMGTLRLVMANSVPRDVVLLSKWIGGYITVLFPAMTALLLGVLVLALHPSIALNSTDWWVILLLLFICMIYIAIFFSVGVFISVISSTTGSAAMRCLFVWLLFVLIIPNATPHIARYFAPTPSMQDIQRQYDRIVADAAERRHADHVRWSKRLSNTKPVKKEEFNRILSRIEERITEIDHAHFTQRRDKLRKVTDAYENQLRRQIQLNRKLSLLSPYAVFTDVATTLANTNGESQAAFLKTAQQYEENYFHERYIEALEKKWNIRRHHRILYPPEFRVSYPELQERVRGSLTGLVLLFFYSAVFFMAGYLLFLRRPV